MNTATVIDGRQERRAYTLVYLSYAHVYLRSPNSCWHNENTDGKIPSVVGALPS